MSLKIWQKLLFGIGVVAGINQNSSATEQQGITWLKNSNNSNISTALQAIYEKEGNTVEIKRIQGYIDEINNSNDDTDY